MSSLSQSQDFSLSCEVDSAKVIYDLLSSLGSGEKDQSAHFTVSNEEINVSVHDKTQSLQGNAHLVSDLFTNYHGGDLSFSINLIALLNCLKMFGNERMGATNVNLKYRDDILSLLLEESGVLTECSMHSIVDLYDDYDFLRSFMSSPIINKFIINSNVLKDILSEIGDLGGNFIQIDIQKDNNKIIFSTDGVLGKCEVELSTIGENLLNYESYSSQVQKYRLNSMMHCMKAVAVAKQSYIRINQAGLLCVQHMIQLSNGKNAFIDFFICCEESI